MAERTIDPYLNFTEKRMSTIYINSYLQAAAWYAGLTDLVAVYQPKGAASLAASYVNLANPGTNNAAPGTAPTWNATDGWTPNGTTQYLTTGITPTSYDYTYIIRFSGATDGRYPFGCRNSLNSRYISIVPSFSGLGGRTYLNGSYLAPGTVVTSGVMAVAGRQGYLNGSADGGLIAVAGFLTMSELFLCARNNGSGAAELYAATKIQAIAICSSTQTAGQIAAASAALALI